VASLFSIYSTNLGLGSLREPGPGLFPFLMSLLLISFSLILFIQSLTGREGSDTGAVFWPGMAGAKRILFVLIGLFVYVFILEYLGYLLSTFLLVFFLMKFVEPQKWTTTFLGAFLIAFLSYLIFERWLRANLPSGPLGF
jgi:putative tricarboxylic transport membrane protein